MNRKLIGYILPFILIFQGTEAFRYNIRRAFLPTPCEQAQARIQDIAEKYKKYGLTQYRISVEKDSKDQAKATSKGIVFNTAYVLKEENDDILAATLFHEHAHIKNNHPQKQERAYNVGYGVAAVSSVLGLIPLVSKIPNRTTRLIVTGLYSYASAKIANNFGSIVEQTVARGHEIEADAACKDHPALAKALMQDFGLNDFAQEKKRLSKVFGIKGADFIFRNSTNPIVYMPAEIYANWKLGDESVYKEHPFFARRIAKLHSYIKDAELKSI